MPRKSSASITADQVRQLCSLSKLTLQPGEEESFKADLSAIVGYFGTLDSAPVKKWGLAEERETSALRRDEPVHTEADPILEEVPKRKGRWVRAPKVF